MSWLTIILIFAASLVAIGLLTVLAWFLYTGYLVTIERRLAARKGPYRELVANLATRERALLEPAIRQLGTLKDFEALEAVLEEQARGVTERPDWLLDAYDRLGLVDKYIDRLRHATQWRERAFAAELLGRVGNAKAVPALLETIQATRSEDADVREISLRALARIADPRAVGPLVEALKRAEVWLAPRIADILVRHGGPVVEPMIAFLDEPARHPARAWAANILGEIKVPRAFPALVRALNDQDDEVRAKAAGALGRLGDRRAVTYLLDHLLSDPAPFVRARIASALGQFNDSEVIDRLVRALGDPAWWVRMRSVEALEQIGPIAESPLMLALDDPDPEICIRAAVALERLGVPNRLISQIEQGTDTGDAFHTLVKFGKAGARELLAEQLLHSSSVVREAMVAAVQSAQRQDLSAELIEVARHDTEARIRAAALESLRALRVTDAIPAALDALGDPNERVRAAAMALVGDLGGGELTSVIRPRAFDPEPVVRAAAARALGLVHSQEAEVEFSRLLRDPAPEVRRAAAEGVGEAHWSGAAPHLVELLGDDDPGVRKAAAVALGLVADASVVPALVRVFRTAAGELREVITGAIARLDVNQLPTLIDILLEGQDVESRLALVHTVAQIRAGGVMGLLEILWRDTSPAVRAAAGEVLGHQSDARASQLLANGLDDPDEKVRAMSVDGLVRHQQDGNGPRIRSLLEQDPSALVRERSALAVGLFRPAGGEVDLLKACHLEEPLNVRAAAVLAIGAYDQESMVARVLEMADEAPLRELLRDRLKHDPEYRLLGLKLREARQVELRALGASTREQMEAALAEGMRGVLSPAERIRLVAGLKAFQGDRSRSALLQVVRGDPSPEVRAAALIAVGGMLDVGELLLTARRALDDPHTGVRHAAIAQFSRIAPEQALPALIRMLRADDNPAILQAVAEQAERAFDAFVDLTLGLALDGHEAVMVAKTARYIHHPDLKRLLSIIGRSRAVAVREVVGEVWAARPELIDPEVLETMTIDPVVPVRRQAGRAWLAAGRFDRVEAMLGDPDPNIRLHLALGFLTAPDSKPLDQLSADPDEMVRAAIFAVRLLRGELSEPPAGLALSRSDAANAIRLAIPTDALYQAAQGELDTGRRRAAALALAVLDDSLAYQLVRNDPVRAIRDQVSQMLAAWGNSPEARRQA